jgi:hypothetical protein
MPKSDLRLKRSIDPVFESVSFQFVSNPPILLYSDGREERACPILCQSPSKLSILSILPKSPIRPVRSGPVTASASPTGFRLKIQIHLDVTATGSLSLKLRVGRIFDLLSRGDVLTVFEGPTRLYHISRTSPHEVNVQLGYLFRVQVLPRKRERIRTHLRFPWFVEIFVSRCNRTPRSKIRLGFLFPI